MRGCVFLDRDGVVNVAPPPGQYILSWDQFRFVPEIVDWIRLFKALGLLVIVITNQRAVARGLLPMSRLLEIHDTMTRELGKAGARLDDIFCCPHEELACDCRKPKPGLILQAQRKWNIDLEHSIMIGDSDADELLARTCGLRFIRVGNGRILSVGEAAKELPCR